MKTNYARLYVIGIAILMLILLTLFIVTIAHGQEVEPSDVVDGPIIWVDTCQGGTWVVIEDEDYDLWAVWCARFNWDTRALRWIRGRECIPHYSTKVTVLENILGTPKAICRYKYLMFGIWPRFGGS